MPLTFVLQLVNNALLLGSALLCLRAARFATANVFHGAAWRLTGVAFVVHALDLAVQHGCGAVALAAGMTSPTMQSYGRWLPVFNHGRTFLLYGMLLGLLLLCVYRREPDRRFWRACGALLAVGFVAGTALGLAEGPFREALHYSAVVKWDVVELLLLMATMFVLLLTSRADRALWALFSAYGISLALGVFSFTLLTQIGVRNAWHPQPWTLQAERLVFHTLMVAAALWRIQAGRRGKPVPAMLERSVRPVTTMA
ncbi:MAG TPA: hypothetical protein VJT67_13250 [Longimicrobiaceae bacterium]|nr:hypothetical protein [Longimicrobiaceae bacterium]